MDRSAAFDSFSAGAPLIVIDDRPGVAPATMVLAAASVTTEQMSFLVRHTSGFVSVALPASRCDRLDLPALAQDPFAVSRPVAGVSVDAAAGVSTGISAADRSLTARLLADPGTRIDQLTRPGHLVSLRVPDAARAAECVASAALLLCRLGGLVPAAVCCELVEDAGELMAAETARAFAIEHGLGILTLAEIATTWSGRALVRATA